MKSTPTSPTDWNGLACNSHRSATGQTVRWCRSPTTPTSRELERTMFQIPRTTHFLEMITNKKWIICNWSSIDHPLIIHMNHPYQSLKKRCIRCIIILIHPGKSHYRLGCSIEIILGDPLRGSAQGIRSVDRPGLVLEEEGQSVPQQGQAGAEDLAI